MLYFKKKKKILFVFLCAYTDSVKTVSCGFLWRTVVSLCAAIYECTWMLVCTPKSECAHLHTRAQTHTHKHSHTPESSSPFRVVIMTQGGASGGGLTDSGHHTLGGLMDSCCTDDLVHHLVDIVKNEHSMMGEKTPKHRDHSLLTLLWLHSVFLSKVDSI